MGGMVSRESECLHDLAFAFTKATEATHFQGSAICFLLIRAAGRALWWVLSLIQAPEEAEQRNWRMCTFKLVPSIQLLASQQLELSYVG